MKWLTDPPLPTLPFPRYFLCMNSRSLPSLPFGLLAGLCSLFLLASFAQAANRPNIIWLFSDDHGWQTLSAYGSKVNQTPNLDRIATEGMRFDRATVSNSICAPCRAVILSGKHSHLNGQLTNRDRFDGEQMTFPKVLRKGGYTTALIGKWHLKSDPTGFDYFDVLIGQGPYYNPPMKTNRGDEIKTVKHTGYTTDIITDKSLAWLKNDRDPDKPFMLMCQHKAPHRNWQPAPRHLNLYDDIEIPEPATLFDDYSGRGTAAKEQAMTIERHMNASDLKLKAPRLTEQQQKAWNAAYDPKNEAFEKMNLEGRDLVKWKYQRYAKDYLRCVKAVDEGAGRILDYLEAEGLAENTVVMYSSDQGWYLGEHGWYDKRWMYEESFRTPLLARWPGVIEPGSVNDDLVQNIDFAQTFLDIAGVEAPADMQGASLVPLMKGQSPAFWRDSVYYHYYEFPGAHSVKRHEGVSTKTHKLIHFYDIGEWEMYDLKNDPDELQSVHGNAEYAAMRTALEAELIRLKARYEVPPPPAAKPPKQPRQPKKEKQPAVAK